MTATPAPLSAPQVRAYLDRIGLASMPADAAPSVELLDALIRAHQLLAVELYAACGLTDNKHQIRHLFPMYAAIDITDTSKTIYHWQYSDYDMDPTDEPFIHARLNKFIYVNNVIRLLYPGIENVENLLISPVYSHDFSKFLDITIIEAKFDYYLQSMPKNYVRPVKM